MYSELLDKKKKIGVIGLGYVGLPIALEFANHFSVVGFDINEKRVDLMKQGIDPSQELEGSAFENKDIVFTASEEALKDVHFFIIAVPTDIDEHKVPNLTPLIKASETVGRAIKPGDYVVYESTVYPGCTEEDCLPALVAQTIKRRSYATAEGQIVEANADKGLVAGVDFKYGYSPERIVPGDKVRTLTKITKIVSGCDEESSKEIGKVYGHIIEAGIYEASSVKVAEAAKVIENTQRDLNISLMNELSIIFDRMGIDTQEVIKAAGTKWNFLKFYPGLVGGHCIGVDPYYLLHKSKQLGYDPQVIASGRRINDFMPSFVAKRLVQLLIEKGKNIGQSKILVKGITFKENVADIRNSKVVDLIRELMSYSIHVHVTDPFASPNEVAHEYNLTLVDNISSDYDAVIVAVNHEEYVSKDADWFKSIMKENPILVDIKAVFEEKNLPGIEYWRL